MTILLEHPIEDKPKKSGHCMIKDSSTTPYWAFYNQVEDKWLCLHTNKQLTHWYEEITLPDDTIIAI